MTLKRGRLACNYTDFATIKVGYCICIDDYTTTQKYGGLSVLAIQDGKQSDSMYSIQI